MIIFKFTKTLFIIFLRNEIYSNAYKFELVEDNIELINKLIISIFENKNAYNTLFYLFKWCQNYLILGIRK